MHLAPTLESTHRVQLAAQALASAWLAARPLPPATLRLHDTDEALAVELATWALLDRGRPTPAAWKVGAADLQAAPWVAPLPAAGLLDSGAVVQGPGIVRRGVELELAVRLGCDIHDPQQLARADDAARCIDSVHAALEVVESRLSGWPQVPALLKQADLHSHGALVLGPAWPWRPDHGLPDLRGVQAVLSVNGHEVVRRLGGHPAPDLPWLLTALARRAQALGHPLRAGQVVTTGSCTGLWHAPAGALVQGRLDDGPGLSLQF